MIKLRNFFDFVRFASNFTQIRPFRPKMAPFDVHFPPFVPKASTFRRGTPPGPPGSAPAYPRCPHEGCDPARRSLHLFTLRLFTPQPSAKRSSSAKREAEKARRVEKHYAQVAADQRAIAGQVINFVTGGRTIELTVSPTPAHQPCALIGSLLEAHGCGELLRRMKRDSRA